MSYAVALVTDSTCDIPLEWRQRYEIIVVPLVIVFGEEQYRDGVDLTPEAFYARLEKGDEHPTTSQATPEDFLRAYQEAAERGAREIVAILISSKMSGTIEAARRAAEGFPLPVHVVDSRNNSMGLGWQVLAAARVREQGGDVAAMLQAVEAVRRRMVYYVSLDTLKYLARGGRIGGATRFLGQLLQIKPLVYVDPETGTVMPSVPSRSRSAALETLFREFFKHMDTQRPMHIAVLHNAALEDAHQLAERVRQSYNPAELIITYASPVLGAHTGPRAVALCGYSEP